MTEPAAALNGSKRPSSNLTAGSVRLVVGNPGVERVMLMDDSRIRRGETVRV